MIISVIPYDQFEFAVLYQPSHGCSIKEAIYSTSESDKYSPSCLLKRDHWGLTYLDCSFVSLSNTAEFPSKVVSP